MGNWPFSTMLHFISSGQISADLKTHTRAWWFHFSLIHLVNFHSSCGFTNRH